MFLSASFQGPLYFITEARGKRPGIDVVIHSLPLVGLYRG